LLDRQEPAYTTISGGSNASHWDVNFHLSKKSKYGGWIVQHVTADFPATKDHPAKHDDYWEAWHVDKGAKSPERSEQVAEDLNENLLGLDILLDARVSGSDYEHFNWMQTVTTNYPLPGMPANQSYPDPGPGPLYYKTVPEKVAGLSQESYVERVAQQHGASTIFEDHPDRDLKGVSPVIWHAELFLVGIKKDGSFDVLKRFSCGFTLTNDGVMLESLMEK